MLKIMNVIYSLKLYFISSWLVIIYMLLIYFIGHVVWPEQSGGSLIKDAMGNIRGSYLIAQQLRGREYFHGRPQHLFDEQCNVALYHKNIQQLFSTILSSATVDDLTIFTPSSSKVDPYITRIEARKQISRIAKARDLSVDQLYQLVEQNTLKASWPFFSLDIVNITKLNWLLYQ